VDRDAGTPQVFVSPFSMPDRERRIVSKDGGTQPRWSPDGREIFFIGVDGILMGAPVHGGGTLTIGMPKRVLHRPYYSGFGLIERPDTYDVAPDGRFLMLKQQSRPEDGPQAATVVIVKNWLDELQRLVPVAR
jgi:hypothetical protein